VSSGTGAADLVNTQKGEDNPQKLKRKLLEDYQDQSLEDLNHGEEINTAFGSCYRFRTHEKLEIKSLDQERVRDNLRNDLKLIRGIGEAKEIKLKKEGYETFEDLERHPLYGEEAKKFLNIMNSEDISSLLSCISGNYSSSHPLHLSLSCLKGRENLLFMDIETLGLKNVPLILVGVAETSADGLIINQYLLRDLKEENAVLDGFLSHLDKDSIFVTFNGRSFDLPFIRSRMRYHGMKNKMASWHLDLLHFSRRQWKNQLPNCRLQTLEKHLFGIERCGDVPSSLVPEFYMTYRETDNIGPLVPIIEHNREDVVTLARILSLLHQISDI
jgi:uncharacterized protein YprB with RNaseH-like and TPR domain